MLKTMRNSFHHLKWTLFAVIAVVGLGVLIYDEAHGGRLRERLRGPDPRAPADSVPPRDRGATATLVRRALREVASP